MIAFTPPQDLVLTATALHVEGESYGQTDHLELQLAAKGHEQSRVMKELTSKNSLLKILAVLVTGVVLWSLSPGPAGLEEGYGILSLLPAAVAIVLAFLIRNVLAALFLAIVTGGLVSGKINIIQAFFLPAIGSAQYGLILLVYLWGLGGLLGIWTRTGGAQAFAEWAARWLVQGRRSAKFFAWLMGLVFHQGGTISTVLAGTTVRPVTDKERVSHEELSYIVDSTASPVAGLIPLNVWPTYVAGLVVGTIPLLPDQASAVSFFYRAIPLNFYAIFAVLMPLFFSLEILPWRGRRMGLAIGRVRTTGELNAPEARPLSGTELIEIKTPAHYQPSVLDFLVPVTTLIGCSLGSYFLTGSVLIAEAFGLSVVVAALLAYLRGLRLSEVVEAMVLRLQRCDDRCNLIGFSNHFEPCFRRAGNCGIYRGEDIGLDGSSSVSGPAPCDLHGRVLFYWNLVWNLCGNFSSGTSPGLVDCTGSELPFALLCQCHGRLNLW